uniref:DNA pilot protein n=1 Tax=Geladintestivirus 2 TaxID=3233134 RepID=A0AAU8MI23_9CAUD
MSTRRLKYSGQRRKALFGTEGAIMAAATLAAAGMNVLATNNAASKQAKAITDGAKQQAESIKLQTNNNTTLQKEQLDFARQQNQENRQQQRDIQATLQMIAGQQNNNDRLETNKIQVKYGGRTKRRSIKSQPFYGGARQPFVVTDGGGAIPIQIDDNGYGLYELYGNDHEHSHTLPNGKRKTGVGIKFNTGEVIEGEGNQNSNNGELMYVTPNNSFFLSKHSIDGFNPAKATKEGLNPISAFILQEAIKAKNGYNDDGSKDKRHTTALGNISSPVERLMAKCGGRFKRGNGGILKNPNYRGAFYNSIGNLGGAAISGIGNIWAGNKLGKAYSEAGDIIANAYSQMKGIDMNELKREDYEAPHTLAVIRSANTNINPQLERLRRNANYETRAVNRSTISSAAKQQRLASINDRLYQRVGEQYAAKNNVDEQIKQANTAAINQVAIANADRDVQARQNYGNQRLSLLEYNNTIENAKIAGMAQAKADALTQRSIANASAIQNTGAAIGSAFASSAQGFASASNAIRNERATLNNVLIGADTQNKIDYLVMNPNVDGNREQAMNYIEANKNSTNPDIQTYVARLQAVYGKKNNTNKPLYNA